MATVFSCCVTINCDSGISGGTSDCAVPTVSVTCPVVATGTVGTAYSDAVVASGGTGPYTYAVSAGALPPGLSLNASTGAITGTPSADGVFGVQFQVTDAVGALGYVDCALDIDPAGTVIGGGFLLQEDGAYLLLESGGRIMLDPTGTKPSIGGIS